ncbi:MAG: hypothetical protein R2761_25195 [Acidimicrobiales bacterium]
MHRGFAVAAAVALAGIAPGLAAGPALAEQDGPSVSLTTTVYAGHDGGAGCGGAQSWAEARQGDPVTYCFTVTNTGSTGLASVVVSDPLAANAPVLVSADSTPLAPGGSAHFYLEAVPPADEADGVIDETYLATASASALPVDETGAILDGAVPVIATAEAVVYPPAELPLAGVSLATSVYAGHDGGHGCPAADETLVHQGDAITYCYTVTNTGTTHLAGLSFADLGVDAAPTLLGEGGLPLAPGASLRLFLEADAPADLPADGYTPVPAVTASAVDETGASLTGVAAATGSDGATVRALAAAPAEPVTPAKPLVQKKPAALQPKATAPATTTAPRQLAYTGWETWLVASAGVGLVAVGWLLVNAARERNRLQPAPLPVPVRVSEPERSA